MGAKNFPLNRPHIPATQQFCLMFPAVTGQRPLRQPLPFSLCPSQWECRCFQDAEQIQVFSLTLNVGKVLPFLLKHHNPRQRVRRNLFNNNAENKFSFHSPHDPQEEGKKKKKKKGCLKVTLSG